MMQVENFPRERAELIAHFFNFENSSSFEPHAVMRRTLLVAPTFLFLIIARELLQSLARHHRIVCVYTKKRRRKG